MNLFPDNLVKEVIETIALGHLEEVVLDIGLLLFEGDRSCINVLNDVGK